MYPNPNSLLYILKDSMCVQLLYNDIVVWKQSCEPYPVSIYFRSYTSHESSFGAILYLNFDPYYYTYVYDGNIWVLRKDLSHCYSFKLDPSMHPKDITIVTESGGSEESPSSSEESSSAGYTVYDHGDGIYLYDFGTARCSEVMYRGQTVCKRQSGGPYPKRIVFDTESLTFEFDFKNKTAVYKLNGGWYISEVYDKLEHFKYEFPDWICKQSYHRFGSKLSMKNLKILTSDETDGSGAKPINVHSSMLLYEKWQFGYYYPVHTLYLELRYKNQVLFKSTEYPYRGRPRIVLFDENNNSIWVFFSSGFSFSLNYIDHSDETVLKAEPATLTEPAEPITETQPEEPITETPVPEEPITEKPVPENTIEPASVTIPTATLIELKINKSTADTAFDYADIGIYKTFTCKHGYGFNKITNPKTTGPDEVIWQYSGGDYATKVRLRIDTSTKEKQILLFLASMKYVFLHCTGKGKPFQNVTGNRHKFFNLKVYTKQNDVEKIAKPDQYTISLYHMSIGCTIKYEYLCSKITYEDKVVYKQDDYQALGQIKGVYLDLVRNSMYVVGINDETKVLEAMKNEKPVTLNIRKTDSTDDFDFTQDYEKNVKIFTARGNAIFTKIVKGARIGTDKVIWETTDPKVYGTKVVTDGVPRLKSTKNVTIHLSNGDIKHLRFSDGKWIETSNFVPLDITKTESSIEFDFYTKDEFRTFTAKDDYLFNKVIESKTIGSDTVIWETTNTSEYSTKVTLMITGDEKYMGLLRTDNDVILLHKPPNSDSWDNITSKVPKISELKMSYYDPSGSYFLLKPEKYKVAFNNLLYGYEFNSGVNCHIVKFGDKHLWSHSDDDKFKTIKGVYIYLRNNNFFVVSPSDEKKEITLRSLSSGKEEDKEEDEEEDDGDKETKSKEGDKTKEDEDQVESEDSTPVTPEPKTTPVITPETTPVSEPETETKTPKTQVMTETSDSEIPETGPKPLNDKSTPTSDIKLALDINATHSNNEFEYNDDNGVVTFTTKDNHVFDKVSHGTTDVWQSRDDVFGSLVIIKVFNNVKYLAILLTNNMFKLFKECGGTWKDITSDRSDITKLKFFGEGEAELANTDYTVSIVSYSFRFTYEFKAGVNCKYIKYGDEFLWKHDENAQFSTITAFDLGLITNNFFMKSTSQFKKLEFKSLKYHETNPAEIPKATSSTTSVTKSDSKTSVTLINLDIKKNKSTDQFDYIKEGEYRTFTAKDDHLISNIVKEYFDIFMTNPKNHAIKVVLMGSKKNPKHMAILLKRGNFELLYKSGKGQPWEDITTQRHDVKKLKFIGEGDSELSKNDYKIDLIKLSFTYTFNDGVKCKKIKLGDDEVWKDTDDPKFAELKSISLDLLKDQFSVTNLKEHTKHLTKAKVTLNINTSKDTNEFQYSKDGDIHTYTPKDDYVFNKIVKTYKSNPCVSTCGDHTCCGSIDELDIWTAKPEDHGLKAVLMGSGKDEKFLSILLQSRNFVLLRKGGKGQPWNDITSQIHDVTKLKFLGQNDRELTSSDYEVTFVGLSYQFKFRSGVACKIIKYDNTLLWNHDDDTNYLEIKSLSLDLPKDQFSITNSSDQTKQLTKAKITLDIDKTQSTNELDYSKDDDCQKYTPKDNHVFSKISKGNTVIWESKDTIYSTIARIKSKDGDKYLVVLMDNNMFTLFKQESGKNKPWEDITNDVHDVTKLKFLTDNDSPLTTSDYEVTFVFLSYTYIFNSGVSCKKVKLGDDEVWTHDDDPKFAEINSLSLDLLTNTFSVMNSSDQTKELDFKPTSTPTTHSNGTPSSETSSS
ncbi:SfiI-subtelomeric fragment related protein family member, putative [Theileria annulata]|uniref:SfiI-subtelomeric related protein family member, putative n=1 Tax=Theileria annulata TaxID=5874 RepID=Q4U8D0_THEAN|nr:SfiI-subtelomeric fragment related protein family member, putative [Theileria annulata]CAI76923.1 SfiI-subtelomeric fragment related protein family member, putative [Theileria annulata]